MKNYSFYHGDLEATGLDAYKNDIIELSLIRASDNVQKTWLIKPINFDNIELQALKINGHKLEDITWQTQYGRDNYMEAEKAIIEIENFMGEDETPTEGKCLVGHNINFDKNMMEQTWKKCNAFDSFPFGRRVMDTMIIELFLDYVKDDFAEGYSLSNLSKKYGVKNEKKHSAAADTKCAAEVFIKQVDYFKKIINNVAKT
jgi:DNA polymerase III alpha subunit (gram-positive type)